MMLSVTLPASMRLPIWWLTVGIVLLYAFPVWYLPYFVTIDGPSHLQMAMNIRRLLMGECAELAGFFTFTSSPVPNWISHAMMAALSFVVSPIIAEKMVISLYLILFPFAMWQLLKQINPQSIYLMPVSLLVGFSFFLYQGSYNFLFGICAALCVIGWWLRRHTVPGVQNWGMLMLLQLALYFSHLFGLLLFNLLMGLFCLCSLIGSAYTGSMARRIKHTLFWASTALPALILLIWYASLPKRPAGYIDGALPFSAYKFLQLLPQSLMIDKGDWVLAAFLSLLLVTATVWIVIRRIRARQLYDHYDTFLYASLILMAVIIAAPGLLFGGWVLEPRLQMTVSLLLIGWIARSSFSLMPRMIIIYSSIMLTLLCGYHRYDIMQARNYYADLYVKATSMIPVGSLVFDFELGRDNPATNAFMFGYPVANRCMIDASNFHAREQNTFPLQFAPDKAPTRYLGDIESTATLASNLFAYEKQVGRTLDYVIIRGSNPELTDVSHPQSDTVAHDYQKLMKQLDMLYTLQYDADDPVDDLRVYRRRSVAKP